MLQTYENYPKCKKKNDELFFSIHQTNEETQRIRQWAMDNTAVVTYPKAIQNENVMGAQLQNENGTKDVLRFLRIKNAPSVPWGAQASGANLTTG